MNNYICVCVCPSACACACVCPCACACVCVCACACALLSNCLIFFFLVTLFDFLYFLCLVCLGFLDFFIFFPPSLVFDTACSACSSGGGIFIPVGESFKSVVNPDDEDEPNAVGVVDAFDAAESCSIDEPNTVDASCPIDAGFSNAFDTVDASDASCPIESVYTFDAAESNPIDASGRGSTSEAGEPIAVDAFDAVDASESNAIDESPRDALDSSDGGGDTGDTGEPDSVDLAGNSSTGCVASFFFSFEPNKSENQLFFSSGFSDASLSSVCDSDCDLAYFSFNSFSLFAFSDRSIIPLVNSSHKVDISFCIFLSATFLLCSNNGENKEPRFILYI